MSEHARISPTAHYTSYVWFRNGMSHEALSSTLGRTLHRALLPMNLAYEKLGSRPSLDMMLLARHRVIDHLIGREIAAGRIGQVLEVAAGLSPRGFRFAGVPGLRYVEADLPEMAAHKERALRDAGLLGKDHRVVTIDALADGGPDSLDAVIERNLDPKVGTAIVTEGLIGYFDRASVEGMWRRFAGALRRFPHGVYLSDLNLAGDMGGMRGARAFRALLSAFARGKVHLHYDSPAEAEDALRAAGFRTPRVHAVTDFPDVDVPGRERGHVVRIVYAVA